MDIRPTTKSKSNTPTAVPKKTIEKVAAQKPSSKTAKIRSGPELVIEPVASDGKEESPNETTAKPTDEAPKERSIADMEKEIEKSVSEAEESKTTKPEDTEESNADTEKEDKEQADPASDESSNAEEPDAEHEVVPVSVNTQVKQETVKSPESLDQQNETKQDTGRDPAEQADTETKIVDSKASGSDLPGPVAATNNTPDTSEVAPQIKTTLEKSKTIAPDADSESANKTTSSPTEEDKNVNTLSDDQKLGGDLSAVGTPLTKDEEEGVILPKADYKLPISKAPRRRHKTLKAAAKKQDIKQTTVVDLTAKQPSVEQKHVKSKKQNNKKSSSKIGKLFGGLLLLSICIAAGGYYYYEYNLRPKIAVGQYLSTIATANSSDYSLEIKQKGLLDSVPVTIDLTGSYNRTDSDITADLLLSDETSAGILEEQMGTEPKLVFADGAVFIPTALLFGTEESAEIADWLKLPALANGGFDTSCSPAETKLVHNKIKQLNNAQSPIISAKRTDTLVDVIMQKTPHYAGKIDLLRLGEMTIKVAEFADETCWNKELSATYPELLQTVTNYFANKDPLILSYTYSVENSVHESSFTLKTAESNTLAIDLVHNFKEVAAHSAPENFQEGDLIAIIKALFPSSTDDSNLAEESAAAYDQEIKDDLLAISEALQDYQDDDSEGLLPSIDIFEDSIEAAKLLGIDTSVLLHPSGNRVNGTSSSETSYQLSYLNDRTDFIVSALAKDGKTVLSETP